MVGIHGGMKLSKYKQNKCPACNGIKSKHANTCMNCFRSGLGTHKPKGKSPRYDTELIKLLKEKVGIIKKEQGVKW